MFNTDELLFFLQFSGKRVSIIGLGTIGYAITKRTEALDCPISYYSVPKPLASEYKYYPSPVELATNCDIPFPCCTLTAETHHIVSCEVIQALGPNGILINIGRGGLIDEYALVTALGEGRLGGARLDVFQDEPNVPEELFGLDNVVLSPHAASRTVETRRRWVILLFGTWKLTSGASRVDISGLRIENSKVKI
ncbi:hypothetical protein Drorol1_Dr00013525 [Drosera rotundifolia]